MAQYRAEVFDLRKALFERGYESFREWAEDHGFNPGTVLKTVHRQWGRDVRHRKDSVANRIISKLEKTVKQAKAERRAA